MHPSFADSQARWLSFLQKIESRFYELLSQCEILLPNIIELQDFNTTPFTVAWQGIETQSKELIFKIENTWHEKVSHSFDEIKDTIAEDVDDLTDFNKKFNLFASEQFELGCELAWKLEKALIGFRVRTFSAASRKLQQKAEEVLSKSFQCTQCQSPLPVRKDFFRSYYQTCEYCQTVNTFEPGSIARHVEHFAIDPLAEEQSLDKQFEFLDLERNYYRQRGETPKKISRDAVLEAYHEYMTKFLKARIGIIPDLEKELEKDLEGKMQHLRQSLSE